MGSNFSPISYRKISYLTAALFLSVAVSGCKKKVAPAPAPPPPTRIDTTPSATSAKPRAVSFEAEPSTIEKGTASTLRWSVTGETSDITISPGIGTVAASGNRRVFPSATTSYTLTATGPGGSDTLTAVVTVTEATPPPPERPPVSAEPFDTVLQRDVKDIYFDYDKSDIREDGRNVLTRNAEVLKTLLQQFPGSSVLIEGHADERGSAEYNLGLSDHRATASKEFLIQLGVPGDRLKTVAYGKEKPQCTDSSETCWQSNRRAHFSTGH